MFYFEQLLQHSAAGNRQLQHHLDGAGGGRHDPSAQLSLQRLPGLSPWVETCACWLSGECATSFSAWCSSNYGAVFRDVIGMFNSVADAIYSRVGVGDLFSNWLNDLSTYFTQNGWSSLWGLVTGGISGLLGALLIIVAFIIFPLSYTIFTLFYALYGAVLYVVGPFVLALLPARGFGQLARTYLMNLMVFGAWGVIYGIIQALMTAVNMGSLNAVLNSNGILNSFFGSSQVILLAMSSILFSISIALIPFLASRIVRGELGSTMLVMVGTAVGAARLAASTVMRRDEK